MQEKNAVIIGSGIAGIATAIRLAVQGFRVDVYEKNNFPGGKLHAFEKDGYQFDAGPSLFTQPGNIEEIFKLAGEPIEKYFQYTQVPIACKYFFENGKEINGYTHAEKFAEELSNKVNEKPEQVIQYLKNAENAYEHIGNIFLNHSLHQRKTWLHRRVVKALNTLKYPYLFRSLNQYNVQSFTSSETTQIFNRFATYNGSNPYKAPAMLSLIPHLEMNLGTFYPKGGMISITKALYELAKTKGVNFHFGHAVKRIIHNDGKAIGVVVNENNIKAEVVVSNMDAYFTYLHLLLDEHKAKKIMRSERSSSAVIFYWGINKEFSKLHLHNIFFSKDYRTEFKNLFDSKSMSDDPTVYINITSKMEPGQAPAGTENWFVMINAPENNGQDWERMKTKLRENVISKLSRILGEDISTYIISETISDPVQLEAQTSSYRGSLYGTSSNSSLSAFFRHPNFASSIRGLYFCGGSVHPGGGIPLCLKSAEIVAGMIQDANKKIKHR